MKVSDFVQAAMAVVNVTFYDRSGNIVERPNLAGLRIAKIIPLKNGDFKVIVESRCTEWH
mgnify:CR=1 FL=1|jgi:hypothetical protein